MAPTFWTLDKTERRRWLNMSLKANDAARPSRDPNVWLVQSDTLSAKHGRPVWWRVHVRTGTCSCPGWRQRGMCRHVARGIYEAWNATHQPVSLPIAA